MSDSLKKTSDFLIFGERPERFAHIGHFWWRTWAIRSHRSPKMREWANRSFFNKKNNVKHTKKKILDFWATNFWANRSFIMTNLSESLTVAQLSWATWAIRSWSLICLERPERSLTFTHFSWAIWANCSQSLIWKKSIADVTDENYLISTTDLVLSVQNPGLSRVCVPWHAATAWNALSLPANLLPEREAWLQRNLLRQGKPGQLIEIVFDAKIICWALVSILYALALIINWYSYRDKSCYILNLSLFLTLQIFFSAFLKSFVM